MPVESHVDEARRRIVARVFGNFTLGDIVEAIERSVRDPKFQRGFAVLSDHTEVGEPLTPDQAQQMLSRLKNLSEFVAGSRWAVVTSKPASYGMLRMVSAYAKTVPMDVQVFSSHEEAEAWLSSPETKDP